jgi:hypothetical protein
MSPSTKSNLSNLRLRRIIGSCTYSFSTSGRLSPSNYSDFALFLPEFERFLSFFLSFFFLCFLEDLDFFDLLLDFLLFLLIFPLFWSGEFIPLAFKSISRLFLSIAKISSSPSDKRAYPSVWSLL